MKFKRQPKENPLYVVVKEGHKNSYWEDLYHKLLTSSWIYLIAFISSVYLSYNFLFAALYWLYPESIANVRPGHYWDYFFFSIQTSATIGYGNFYPQTQFAHIIVTLEAIFGFVLTAISTGLIFAKFARPNAKVIFSKNIIRAPYAKKDVLLLRLANTRINRIIEGRGRFSVLLNETTEEGHFLRKIHDLKLERDTTPIFGLSWTLMHVIDANSPLYGKDHKELEKLNPEFFVTFQGTDETFFTAIAANHYYKFEHLLKNKKFRDIIRSEGEKRIIDIGNFHTVDDA